MYTGLMLLKSQNYMKMLIRVSCIWIFHSFYPSSLNSLNPATLWPWGSTQPLTEMSKSEGCVGLTTLSTSCADYLEILGSSTSWNPQGLSSSEKGLISPYNEVNSFIKCKEIYYSLSYYQIRNKHSHNTTESYRTLTQRFMIFVRVCLFKSKAWKVDSEGKSLRLSAA